MRHEMLFLQRNDDVPTGRVTSTARKGDKWTKAKPGDFLTLRITETKHCFGEAVVTNTEKITGAEILRRFLENHGGKPPAELRQSLAVAYGEFRDEDVFTMVHFICTNRTPESAAAIAAIDSERDYQEALKAEANTPDHEIAAYIVFIEAYLRDAVHVSAKNWTPACAALTLAELRKVGALAVACMEDHGAPIRVFDGDVVADRLLTAK